MSEMNQNTAADAPSDEGVETRVAPYVSSELRAKVYLALSGLTRAGMHFEASCKMLLEVIAADGRKRPSVEGRVPPSVPAAYFLEKLLDFYQVGEGDHCAVDLAPFEGALVAQMSRVKDPRSVEGIQKISDLLRTASEIALISSGIGRGPSPVVVRSSAPHALIQTMG